MIILTDIHGCFDTAMVLLSKIPEEKLDSGIAVCGDLIDRGPKSKQVVQWCIDNKVHVIRGNHEDMMIKEGIDEMNYYINAGNKFDWNSLSKRSILWLHNGGLQTLISYIDENGVFDKDTFVNHIEWMKTLPYYLEFKDLKNDNNEYLLLSHSSAAPVWHWSEDKRNSNLSNFNAHLSWGRPNQINAIKDIFNIFGHTPIQNGPKIKSCYANIDTGCCYNGQVEGLGKLTAIEFPSMEIYQQDNVDSI